MYPMLHPRLTIESDLMIESRSARALQQYDMAQLT
jgi:hypothetical protein